MDRLFVALPLPETVADACVRLSTGLQGASWMRPGNHHLTLRFIGEVDGATARNVADALADVNAAPFTLALRDIGVFGERRKARVLWAGVTDSPPLLALQARIERVLVQLGLEPERRKYAPHVTLARLKAPAPARLVRYLEDHAGFMTTAWTVDCFQLYSSFLAHEGAIHRVEAEYPLDLRVR
ncbi:RNA 2',3'-cyclic phosphodiesterase [Oceanibacterium hippocampi]|uniref:RNA 2',3'-cyclic phosphodiesterase n=1 Tax=Oceanibacterium hippocampi TaxID=745714 RepID=A0A1Y5R9E6_9PROT|nr:RNA 2',3'-cyclic phosphodiesterase [Oceanibacterium hippocampi]SLN12221.1 2',5' RNA ligase family [Oceanibacterium hippocampi]